MRNKLGRILFWGSCALLLGITGHVLSQQPRLSLNPEQFGLILLKGGYRSWFASFSDGMTTDGTGPLRSVVFTQDAKGYRFGYRIIPRFSHTDVRPLLKQLEEKK